MPSGRSAHHHEPCIPSASPPASLSTVDSIARPILRSVMNHHRRPSFHGRSAVPSHRKTPSAMPNSLDLHPSRPTASIFSVKAVTTAADVASHRAIRPSAVESPLHRSPFRTDQPQSLRSRHRRRLPPDPSLLVSIPAAVPISTVSPSPSLDPREAPFLGRSPLPSPSATTSSLSWKFFRRPIQLGEPCCHSTGNAEPQRPWPLHPPNWNLVGPCSSAVPPLQPIQAEGVHRAKAVPPCHAEPSFYAQISKQ